MHKILFVCHGNICRSPMAEFIMKDLVKKANLEKDFYIESAATSTEEIGSPVYPPARKILKEHGISSDGKYARQVTLSDYEKFDYIILMDQNNLRNIKYIIPEDKDNKIHLLMSYVGLNRDVADPWYTRNFQVTYNDILEGCTALLEHITK